MKTIFLILLAVELLVMFLLGWFVDHRDNDPDGSALAAFEFFVAVFISAAIDVIYLVVWHFVRNVH